MFGYVYKTTCLINNKVYIGQRLRGFDNEYLGSGILINRAINKYGRNNFSVMVLGYAHDKNSLDILERYYIKLFSENKLFFN